MATTALAALDVLFDLGIGCHALCCSGASIYREIDRGTFQKPTKVGFSSRWRLSAERAANAKEVPIAK